MNMSRVQEVNRASIRDHRDSIGHRGFNLMVVWSTKRLAVCGRRKEERGVSTDLRATSESGDNMIAALVRPKCSAITLVYGGRGSLLLIQVYTSPAGGCTHATGATS
jgi:hypothetical protein